MANYKKFFDLAKEEGLEALELSVSKSSEFSFQLFRNEIENYNISDSFTLNARGIYNGKIGYANSEKLDASTPEYIIKHIKENATLTTSEDKPFIYEGSKKYSKKNVFNKALAGASKEEKIALVKALDNEVRKKSELIKEVQTMFSEQTEEFTLMNSYGLKLSSKNNYAFVFTSAIAVDAQGETKNGMAMKILGDLSELNIDETAQKAVDDTLSQFGSGPCASRKYKCVFSPRATSSLLSAYLQSISAEQVQKKSSLLAGKLNEKVASSRITVTENPLQKNVFFRYFDDEGVATANKTLIKSGVLQTYLYDLKTAAKDGVESTGNGFKGRDGSLSIRPVNVVLKPGKLSEEELIAKCKNGIYINDLSGLHAGLNPQSGNFSLLSSGFLIEDGKKTKPVALITSAGNLFDVFNSVLAVGSNLEMQMNSMQVPSILVKSIAVSGE